MSNKRVKIREMKRKQKQQKMLFITIGIAVAVLIVLGFTWYGVDQHNKRFIMTYQGDKIEAADFYFYASTATDETDPKGQALTQMLTQLALEYHAKADGLWLTDEEQSQMESLATSFRDYYKSYYNLDLSFISDKRMGEILGVDTVYAKMMEKYTEGYTVDEADFQSALANYKENNKADYYDIQLRYIMTSELADIDKAWADLDAGADFDEVLRKYSSYYSEEEGVEYGVDTYSIQTFNFTPENAERILALSVGDLSGIIDMTDEYGALYGIYKVDSYEIPSDEEIETTYRETYENEKKTAIFDEILNGWKESAEYTLNQRVYDEI